MIRNYILLVIVGFCIYSDMHVELYDEIIIYERDPWRMVIGSDSPIFAHYSDGTTIYLVEEENRRFYKSVVLDDKRKNELRNIAYKLRYSKEYYELSHWTDQPSTDIYLRNKDTGRQLWIYGDLNDTEGNDSNAPRDILKFIEYIVNFSPDNGEQWQPQYVEFIFWPYDHSGEPPLLWPESWPDLNSEMAVERRKDNYSLYIPYPKADEVFVFLSKQAERGGVKINGRIWSVSYRIPFPHEILLYK